MKVAALLLLLLGLALAVAVAFAALGSDRDATRAAPAATVVAAQEQPGVVVLPADPRAARKSIEAARAVAQVEESTAPEEPRPETTLSFEDGDLQRAWYDNGQLEYEGHQIETLDGRWVREGPWEAYHPNGALHELGAYENDEEVGEWRWWHDNGVRMAVGQFDAGKRVGAWTYWFENGMLQASSTYAGGKAHGPWTTFHENGAMGGQGEFKEGKLSGPWTIWHPDGTLNVLGTGTYEDGEKVGD